jgi:hypothetical protein
VKKLKKVGGRSEAGRALISFDRTARPSFYFARSGLPQRGGSASRILLLATLQVARILVSWEMPDDQTTRSQRARELAVLLYEGEHLPATSAGTHIGSANAIAAEIKRHQPTI